MDGDIALAKGGVITGRVLDDLGAPLPLFNVVAIRRHAQSGPPRFERVATAATDDQGEYRIFGLPAGDYVVAAAPARVLNGTLLATVPVKDLVLRHYFGPADTQEGARTFAVRAGEDVPGIDLTFPLPAMAALQAQAAPTPRPRPGASAVIRGRVLRADGLPLRRGRVQLASSEGLFSPYGVVTDDEGRYEFANLQAGTYLLGAATLGMERAVYGPRGEDRGTPVTLRAGQIAEGIDMALQREGVIGGRVLDEYGDPMEHVSVRVERIETVRGRRQIVAAAGTAMRWSSDQGRYRIFSLRPGRYLVTAVVGETAPGVPPADAHGYARTYFPGTAVPADAQVVEMSAGQEALTLDVTLTRGRVARIAGTVRMADGSPLQGVVALSQSVRSGALATPRQTVRTGEDGAFEFVRLPPGEYVLQAGSSRGSVATEGETAQRFITVDGADVTDLDVRLSRGSTIEGRLVYEDADPPVDPDFRVSPVPADPDLASIIDNAPARADFNDDGTFEIAGISGPRRIQLTQAPDGWALKAVRLNGVDVTDSILPFGTAEQSLRGVEIVLTTHVASLTVTDRAAAGGATGDFRAVVFAADASRRDRGSRFGIGVPGPDGAAVLRSLLPGDYYVAAMGQDGFAETLALDEKEFLESLIAKGAVKITLTEGERRSVSVNVIGR